MPSVRKMGLALGRVSVAVAPLLLAALIEAGCSSDQPVPDRAPPLSPFASGTTTSTRDAGGPVDAGGDADDLNCLGDVPDGAGACPTTGACAAPCANVATLYKTSIAVAVARCVVARRSCVGASDVSLCLDEALVRSCSDSTATSYCAPLVLACDPTGSGSVISQEGCEKFALGFNAKGRATFASCLANAVDGGKCADNIVACADAIRP